MNTKWSVVSGRCSVVKHAGAFRRVAASPRYRVGFSLVEVLLAIFILGIGMIMVASVFPVGANWTRQATEESNAQTIVKIAHGVIKTHFGPDGDMRALLAPDFSTGAGPNPGNYNSVLKGAAPFEVQPLPGLTADANPGTPSIPASERAYQFGNSQPFPAPNWRQCTYFWSAAVRLNPMHRNPTPPSGDPFNGIIPASSYNYDIYVLVFRKGAVEHTYAHSTFPTRDEGKWGNPDYMRVPSLITAPWQSGSFSGSTWTVDAVPPIGQYGIGVQSGTVFKQVVNAAYNGAEPRPMIIPGEQVIISPAADGTSLSASPLIYVYQTTMQF
jgi:type II secretory pathway pseudopilin PulG